MIISPYMLKTAEKSKKLFIRKYVENIPEIKLAQPFMLGKEIHALAGYFLSGQDITKLENSLNEKQKKVWKELKNSKYMHLDCIGSEYSVNAKLGDFWIGGRIDALMKDGSDYYILDYKTGTIPKNAVFDYQTMVYLYCVDKLLKRYGTLNFVYIGLKEGVSEKIVLSNDLKEEYKNLLLRGCLQIRNLL